MKLPTEFYMQDTRTVAKELLGKVLVRKIGNKTLSGIIVETEAYLGNKDPACHSFGNKKTARNKSMFLSGGHSYVYFIYGMYFCFNVVTNDESAPEAVLIRAIEPLAGIKEMRSLRNVKKDIHLTSGPGKLCMALSVNQELDGLKLNSSKIFICERKHNLLSNIKIAKSPRIGINAKNAGHSWKLRYYIKSNP